MLADRVATYHSDEDYDLKEDNRSPSTPLAPLPASVPAVFVKRICEQSSEEAMAASAGHRGRRRSTSVSSFSSILLNAPQPPPFQPMSAYSIILSSGASNARRLGQV